MQEQVISKGPALVLGVDPGLTGALAFFDLSASNIESVFDMPVKKIRNSRGRVKTVIDIETLATLISVRAPFIVGAAIEEVGAAPHQGLSSTFNFGYSAGIIRGLVAANFIKTIMIRPAVWKSALGLSSDKQESRNRAKAAFAAKATLFNRARDDGRAEAALLAMFAAPVFMRSEKK
jgi:crossover junction endodeoxyribonuclease RuvC